MTRTLFVSCLSLAFALPALAADINGSWKGTAEGPNGAIARTFTFKVDGTAFTGETVSSFLGKSDIKDGKIEGENISFSIKASFQGNESTIKYTGKSTSGSFKLTSTFSRGDFPPIEWTLTRSN